MSTYYVKNGGNDGNSGLSDLLAWATVQKVNTTGFSPGDSILFKRGSLWRETLDPQSSGTSGNPITLGAYDTGPNPVISGADLVTGWTNYSGNIWQATLANNDNDKYIFINGTVGDKKTSIGALVNEYDHYWASNVMYLYAPSDPDTHYTNPGVEARIRQAAIYSNPCSYVVFDGLTAEKSWGPAFTSYFATGYITVKNCIAQYANEGLNVSAARTGDEVHDSIFRYNQTSGIVMVNGPTNAKIYRNETYENNTVITDVGGGGAGIKIFGDGVSGIEMYENYIHEAGLSAIWVDYVHPASPILIHHNYIKDTVGDGVFIEISSDVHVYYNVMENSATDYPGEAGPWTIAGVNISGRETFLNENNLIYNNTIYGANVGINVWMDGGTTTGRMNNNIVKNNIVLNSITRPFSAGHGGDNLTYGSGNTYQYNCFGVESSNFINWQRTGLLSTYDAWEAADGVILDSGSTHSIEADPLFTNAGAGDFTLQETSPCIDAGANLGATYKYGVMHDSAWPAAVVLGDQGAHGAGWEVGAYIYQSGSAWIIGALAVGGT